MTLKNKIAWGTLLCVFGSATALVSIPARASDAGAFIGGVFATKLIQNAKRRTEAEEAQANAAQTQAYAQPVSSASAPRSTKQRLDELDKLAAGGYITPEEYKRKKQRIIDSL